MEVDKPDKVWDGVYRSFAEADGESGVFQGTVWLDKVVSRTKAALEQAKQPSAISPAATTLDYVLPCVAALASQPGKRLRILDFGGGLAASYVPLIAMLPSDQQIEFVVVENQSICEKGKELFDGDERIRFITQVPMNEKFDIVHAGSSMHYVDDWQSMIAGFAALRPEYLLFADVPAGDIPTFVTAQLYYGRRIPVRFWDADEFVAEVQLNYYRLIFKARYRGYYLPPSGEFPTQNFDEKHRLKYSSQFIFKRVLHDGE